MTDTMHNAPQAPAPTGPSRLQTGALIAEIIGAVAIVVSLVFVGLQIQQNTKATRAASAYEINRMWAQFNLNASFDEEQSLLWSKLLDPSNPVEDFSDVERARIDLVILGVTQGHMAQFRLYQEGSLLRRDWEADGKWAAQFRHLPLVKRYYDSTIAAGLYDADFIAELDRLDAQVGEESVRLSDYAKIETAEEQPAEGKE